MLRELALSKPHLTFPRPYLQIVGWRPACVSGPFAQPAGKGGAGVGEGEGVEVCGTAQGARTPTRFYAVNMLYLPCVAVRAEDLSIPASLSL